MFGPVNAPGTSGMEAAAAKKLAEEAKATSDTAATSAETAKTTANEAKSVAEMAQTTANAAKTAAAEAKTAVGSVDAYTKEQTLSAAVKKQLGDVNTPYSFMM